MTSEAKNFVFYYKKLTFWVFQLHFIHCLFGSLQVVSLHQLNEKGYNFFPVCTHMQEYVKTFNLSGRLSVCQVLKCLIYGQKCSKLKPGFRVQSALNPILEIEHSLDLEHFKPSTDRVP